jgi:phage head maturation protease
MTDQPLSPAAQAALKAFDDRYELIGPFDGNWQELCLAAVFRALADHDPIRWDGSGTRPAELLFRIDLRGLAYELENAND